MSARVMARETWLTPSRYCCGEAEMMGQLPSGKGWSVPSQARRVDALAPAWPICRAKQASVLAWIQSAMRLKAAVCSGL
ncbi:hypothetical protein CDEF62S_01523 [Castellaniella defragrans]